MKTCICHLSLSLSLSFSLSLSHSHPPSFPLPLSPSSSSSSRAASSISSPSTSPLPFSPLLSRPLSLCLPVCLSTERSVYTSGESLPQSISLKACQFSVKEADTICTMNAENSPQFMLVVQEGRAEGCGEAGGGRRGGGGREREGRRDGGARHKCSNVVSYSFQLLAVTPKSERNDASLSHK